MDPKPGIEKTGNKSSKRTQDIKVTPDENNKKGINDMVSPIIFFCRKKNISARTPPSTTPTRAAFRTAGFERWLLKKTIAASEGHVSKVSQVQSAEVNEGGIQHRRL